MKKRFLLSIALGMAGMAANADVHNIYVANLSDWGDDVALYSWGDSEIFGGWPGATPSETVTLNDVKYNLFTIDGHDGEVIHPIFNNNNNGQQIDLPMLTLEEENYYFATNGIMVNQYADPADPDIDFGEVTTFVYAIDNTGWDNLYVYAWSDGQPEVFGGWPGTKLEEEVEIDGQKYKKAPFPGNGTIEYNLIFNNGDADQYDGPSIPSGQNVYLSLDASSFEILPTPAAKLYNIYIEDHTNWDALYLYAYVGASPSIFGAWPGKEVTETETIDGVDYKVIKDVEATDVAQIFILNDNAGNQVDVTGEYPITENIFLYATDKEVTSGVEGVLTEDDSEIEYYTLQGIRVAAPSKGIYICKRGSKVTKVVR